MTRNPCRIAPVSMALTALALTGSLTAQWPTAPAPNLGVGTAASEQVLPKIAPTRDGGYYVGWFDLSSGAYTVRLQRLDAGGNPQWGPTGILVSNNPQSTSLVDWDLICDRDDHCVLAFTDTRAGGDLDVYAYRIDPTGGFRWGSNGIALSNNADYEPNPRICQTTDGDFVFVWPNTGLRTIQLQKINDLSGPRFGPAGISVPGDTGATPAFCSVVAADAGGFIVSWVRTTSFSGARHIHAQKFDVLGTALWNGGTRLAVFDQTSLPIAHDPKLLTDGAGGAVLAWHYAATTQFTASVQRILANGTEAFPHNGVPVAVVPTSCFDPAITFNPSTNEIVAFWNERDLNQSSWGISAQLIDAAGNRMWTNTGTVLLARNNVVKFAPVAVRFGSRSSCFVLEQSLGGLNSKVVGMQVDRSGAVTWTNPVDVSNVASDKLRLSAKVTFSGMAQVVWTDKRADGGDNYAMAVGLDGTLGPALGSVTAYGCGVNPPFSLVLRNNVAVGTTNNFLLDNLLGTQGQGSLAVVLIGFTPPANYPCGTQVPGWGMAGFGAPGEVLIDTTAGVATLVGNTWNGPTQFATVPFTLPLALQLQGARFYAQGALLDGNPTSVAPIGLTNALNLVIGY
jgi:hypothetical protein